MREQWPTTDTETLDSFVREAVAQNVRLIATNEHSGYRLLGKDFNNGVVTHTKSEYVGRYDSH